MEWVKKESTYIITPSQATQEDVAKFLSIPLSKITPLYSGVEIQKPSENSKVAVIKKFNVSQPFILSVGKLEPRKNITRLIDAFLSIKKKGWQLIIVGPHGWDDKSDQKKRDQIIFTGYVSEMELHALYEQCQFFVYPSLWEGFGYPVVEAMMHKKAVAVSNNSSLLELAHGRGIVFDPLSTPAIAEGLQHLIDDKALRNELAEKGFVFSQEFTWKRYYEGLMKTIS